MVGLVLARSKVASIFYIYLALDAVLDVTGMTVTAPEGLALLLLLLLCVLETHVRGVAVGRIASAFKYCLTALDEEEVLWLSLYLSRSLFLSLDV